MTLVSDVVDQFRPRVSGAVITAEDDRYDDVRRLWNADHDVRPAVVVQCLTAADVAAALSFAIDRGLEVAVRGGAHSTIGASSVEGGLVVDLSQMNAVAIDPERRRARVGGGALLGQLDAAAREHGLATPAGTVSHTGVGGLTLGGGMGWLTRKFGLAIDNLRSAEVVLADGRILRCSEDEEPHLFWALRGAGVNFGVVTEFEFDLHELDPMTTFGLGFWSLDQGAELLRRVRDLFDGGLSRDVNLLVVAMSAPPAPFVPEEVQFTPGYAVATVSFGGEELYNEVAAELRRDLPPLFSMQASTPFVAVQQFIDEANAWGVHAYEKGVLLPTLSDDAIAAFVANVPGKVSPLSVAILMRLDGAYCDVPDDATAFGPRREPGFQAFLLDVAPNAELFEADKPWVRGLWAALEPYSARSVYVNGTSDFTDDRVRAIYGPKYDRLARLKAVYDPHNVFHRTANIRPASADAGAGR